MQSSETHGSDPINGGLTFPTSSNNEVLQETGTGPVGSPQHVETLSYQQSYYQRNKDRIKAQVKAYREANRERVRAQKKQYRLDNLEEIKARDKAYYEEHKEIILEQCKVYGAEYRANNVDKEILRRKVYREQNKQKIALSHRDYKRNNREKVNAYMLKRRREKVWVRVAESARARINQALQGKKKGLPTLELLGIESIDKLKEYLQNKFTVGMTWDTYGRDGWHIDHIKPLASFDLTKEEEKMKAFHYTNLQPLWESDNCAKGAKILES